MALNFSQMLMEAKRKAQLSGRPLAKQEVSGISEGYADTASERLARAKALAIEDERIKQEKEQFEKSLQQRKEEQYDMKIAAERAHKDEAAASQKQTALVGGVIGYKVGGPVGAVVGAIGGAWAEGFSWLCTQTVKYVGLKNDELYSLERFRAYALDNHFHATMWYLVNGPEIVKAIENKENDIEGFYRNLKENMVLPVIVNTDSTHMEKAYDIYESSLIEIITEYKPSLLDKAKEVSIKDRELWRAA